MVTWKQSNKTSSKSAFKIKIPSSSPACACSGIMPTFCKNSLPYQLPYSHFSLWIMAIPFLMLHFCAQLFSFCFFTGEKDMILASWDDTPVYYFAMHLCCRWTSEWEGSGKTLSFYSCFETIQNFHSLSSAKGLSNLVDYMAKDKIYAEVQIFSLSVPFAAPIRISQC